STNYIRRTDEANTALAFVSLTKEGERDFSFYRKPSADMLYQPSNIDAITVTENDMLHFCSVDLVDSPMKQAHKSLINKVKSANGTIIFDPNVRLPYGQVKRIVKMQFVNSCHQHIYLKFQTKNCHSSLEKKMKKKQSLGYSKVV